MKRLLFSFLSGSLIALSFTAGQVFAQSPTPRGAKVRSEAQERKQELRDDMCQRVTDRIGEHRQQWEQHRENRANIYRGVISRLKGLVTKLEGRGCSASQVTADLTTLETMVDEMVAAFNLFLDKLHAVGTPVCQDQPGDWKAAMAEVKTQLQVAKTKQREIRDFYKNTLRPHVKAAGQACKAAASPVASPKGTND